MRMKWEQYNPWLRDTKNILTHRHLYTAIRPYFGVPNVFYKIRTLANRYDVLTRFINETADIYFEYVGTRPVVLFAPCIAQKYKTESHRSEQQWAINFVATMLQKIGFKTEIIYTKEMHLNTNVVCVALDDAQNLKLMRHMAPYFAFHHNRMLTPQFVHQLSQQNQRTKH